LAIYYVLYQIVGAFVGSDKLNNYESPQRCNEFIHSNIFAQSAYQVRRDESASSVILR
jgi:hypothetical protein